MFQVILPAIRTAAPVVGRVALEGGKLYAKSLASTVTTMVATVVVAGCAATVCQRTDSFLKARRVAKNNKLIDAYEASKFIDPQMAA